MAKRYVVQFQIYMDDKRAILYALDNNGEFWSCYRDFLSDWSKWKYEYLPTLPGMRDDEDLQKMAQTKETC